MDKVSSIEAHQISKMLLNQPKKKVLLSNAKAVPFRGANPISYPCFLASRYLIQNIISFGLGD
jgi:hypothetical protein